jgi:transposase
MRLPLFVRPLEDAEPELLKAGLRSPDAFTVRRCQILLASARGERPAAIARSLGCTDQTVRNAIHAFHQQGVACLTKGSSRAHQTYPAFAPAGSARLREIIHQSPRCFGKASSVWTLDLAAEVAHEQGVTARRVTGETVRVTLGRQGVRWRRAKQWITSPDPAYTKKKPAATG